MRNIDNKLSLPVWNDCKNLRYTCFFFFIIILVVCGWHGFTRNNSRKTSAGKTLRKINLKISFINLYISVFIKDQSEDLVTVLASSLLKTSWKKMHFTVYLLTQCRFEHSFYCSLNFKFPEMFSGIFFLSPVWWLKSSLHLIATSFHLFQRVLLVHLDFPRVC